MSIMEYFSKPVMGQAEDSLYPYYRELMTIQKELPQLRQKQLIECCGAAMGKAGEIKLTVVDQELFSRLAGEITAKEARATKIQTAFQGIDVVVDEVVARGIRLKAPTASGISQSRQKFENQIYSSASIARDGAIEALRRGASLKDIASLDADPSLQETVTYLKDVEQRCNAAIKDL